MSVLRYNMKRTIDTDFFSRTTPPASRGTPTAPLAKTRAAAAAALIVAGMVDSCFFFADQYACKLEH